MTKDEQDKIRELILIELKELLEEDGELTMHNLMNFQDFRLKILERIKNRLRK